MNPITSNKHNALSRYQFREKYGDIPREEFGLEIDPKDVPENFRELIPLAEKWGIRQVGWVPQNVIRKVPKWELEDLIINAAPYINSYEFDRWLAGPEAAGPNYSLAYLAFTELRIVFDDAEWVVDHWNEIHSSKK